MKAREARARPAPGVIAAATAVPDTGRGCVAADGAAGALPDSDTDGRAGPDEDRPGDAGDEEVRGSEAARGGGGGLV